MRSLGDAPAGGGEGHPDPAPPRPVRSSELAHVLRGSSIALLGSVLGGGVGFVFTVVMARALSQEEFGLLVLLLTLLLGAASLSAGYDYAAIRFVSTGETPGRKRGAVVTPLVLAVAMAGVAGLLLAALAEPVSRHLLGEPTFVNELRAMAVVLPLTVAAQNLSAGLSGLERAQGELIRKLVEQGGRVLLGPAAVALGLGLVGVVFGMAVAAAAAVAAVGLLLVRALPRGGHIEPASVSAVMRYAWPQMVANGAAQLWLIANVALLARSEGSATVALFGAALALALLPGLFYNAVSFRFSSVISRLWSSGQHDELEDLMRSVTRWVTLCTLPVCAIALALPAAILELYGPGYREGDTALVLLISVTLVNSIIGPVELALIMTGRVRLEMIANVSCAIVTTGLAVILTARFGLVGAATSVLAYSLLLNGTKWVMVQRSLGLQTLSPSLLGPAAAAAVAGAITWVLARATDLDQALLGMLLLVVVLIGSYLAFLVGVVGVSGSDREAFRLALRTPAD